MSYIKFYNVLFIIVSIFKNSDNILTSIGSAKVIPENYHLLFDFSSENDCRKKCVYSGQVNITMKFIGRADVFTIHTDSKMIIYKDQTR